MQELTERINIAIKYKNYSEYAQLQIAFHDININLCGNAVLINTLNTLRFSFVPQTYVGSDADELFSMLAICNDEHKELIHCFQQQDEMGVESILKNHWVTKNSDFI